MAGEMDPREQFLARFTPDAAMAAFPSAPKAQTQMMNLGAFLRNLHEKGGVTRAPGSYGLEDLERLAGVYSRRSPEMLTGEGPFLGSPKQRDTSVIDALMRAQAARGRAVPAAPAPVENQGAGGRELFGPGGGGLEQILRAIAERTGTNYLSR